MAITLIKGTITNLASTVVRYHIWTFRVDNRPMLYKTSVLASFSNGDEITAACQEKNGEFIVFAIRNETTGLQYEGRATVVLVCGAALIFTCIGIPFSIWAFMSAAKMMKANKMIRAEPPRPKS